MDDFTSIYEKKHKKINTLVLEGVMLLSLLLGDTHYGFSTHDGDFSAFHLSALLDKNCGLMEEPRITMSTVDNFKQLLGGEEMDIQVKHKDSQPNICVDKYTNWILGQPC